MPISQATILAIYGDLVDLVEKIETIANQAVTPTLFDGPGSREEALIQQILALNISANEAHEEAIAHLLAEAPELEMNPLTGRIDE